MPRAAAVADVVYLCDASRSADAEVVDLVVARDFLCGTLEPASWSAPPTAHSHAHPTFCRTCAPPFAAVQPAVRLREAGAALRALMHHVGFDDDDTLEGVARWHLARLD